MVQLWVSAVDLSCRGVCLLSSLIEPDGTSLVELNETKTDVWKTQQQHLFPKIMTRLLSVRHTPGWQKLTGGTTFAMYHHAGGESVFCIWTVLWSSAVLQIQDGVWVFWQPLDWDSVTPPPPPSPPPPLLLFSCSTPVSPPDQLPHARLMTSDLSGNDSAKVRGRQREIRRKHRGV